MRGTKSMMLVAGVLIGVAFMSVLAMAENMGQALDRLKGSDISVREFLLQVSPEVLYQIPQEAWDTKVVWGDSLAPTPTRRGTPLDEAGAEASTYIVLSPTWCFYTQGKQVTYGGSTTIIWPPFFRMDALSVYCFLLEDGVNIDIHFDYDTNVWRVTSQESYIVSGGAYYQNMIYHMGDAPAGYNPPIQFVVSYSNTYWINE